MPLFVVKTLSSYPFVYRSLGRISLVKHFSPEDNQRLIMQRILNVAKQKASAVGANAIVIQSFVHAVVGTVPSQLATYQFNAEAIHADNIADGLNAFDSGQ